MKNLVQHIQEKLRISNDTKSNEHTLFPKSNEELEKMIKMEIENNGPECSLNHIDVSEIEDFSHVFSNSKFNGNISDWDVSNAINMTSMFYNCSFTGENGDISDWDVSNVESMQYMFEDAQFNGDINNWNVSNVTNMTNMFRYCPLENNPPKWYKQ
jgi:surface protein